MSNPMYLCDKCNTNKGEYQEEAGLYLCIDCFCDFKNDPENIDDFEYD